MKKMWKENRVLLMLLIILGVCFIAILCVALTFFYNKDVTEYGNRLDGIEKHPITETFKNSFEDSLMDNSKVKSVTFNIQGRVIYLHIDFDEKTDLEDAKSIAISSLDKFKKNTLEYYDIDFVLQSDGFTILGAKNSKSDHVSWNNNRDFSHDNDEEEVGA